MLGFFSNFSSLIQSEGFFYWFFYSVCILILECVLLFVSVRWYYHYQLNKADIYECNDELAHKIALEPYCFLQVLFEILISNTCIISTFWLYSFLMKLPFFQNDFSNYFLLILIVCSILLNNFFDNRLKQDMLSAFDIGNIRLISSISIILLVGLLWFIYRTENCQQFLTCYISLVLGRFVFYDTLRGPLKAVFKDCAHAKYLIPSVFALIFTFSVFGLGLYYFLIQEANVINSLVMTHWEMILCVYVTKEMSK